MMMSATKPSLSSPSHLKAFNVLFGQFFEFIMRLFPENGEVQKAFENFENIRRLNPTIIMKVWKKYIYLPYRSEIDACDLSFIIQKDYEQDLTMFSNTREILKIIDSLRAPIQNIRDSDKECAMKFIQNLSKLSLFIR